MVSISHLAGVNDSVTRQKFVRTNWMRNVVVLIPFVMISLVVFQRQPDIIREESYIRGNKSQHSAPLSRENGQQTIIVHQNPQPRREKIRLDFIVAGFPKCGTTTLLHSFLKNNETTIAPREFCAMNGKTRLVIRTIFHAKPRNLLMSIHGKHLCTECHFFSHPFRIKWLTCCQYNAGSEDSKTRFAKLNEVLNEIPNPSDLPVRRGIKCPMSIWDTRGIQLISSNFKYIKIIVGLRHPVHFFQSFYNYRFVADEIYAYWKPMKVNLILSSLRFHSFAYQTE